MHSDFKDLLAAFCAHQVEFLLVGAHALAAHGLVRATKDMDVWVRPTSANADRVLGALAEFGAPLHDLTRDDLAQPGIIFQIGLPPVRIDVLTAIDGVAFEEAWPARHSVRLDEIIVPVLSRQHLIQNKRSSARLQDLADVENLERLDPPA